MTKADAGDSEQSATTSDRAMFWRGRVRGGICIVTVVLAPVLAGGAYSGIQRDQGASSDEIPFADKVAFMALWGWGNFVYPHPSIVDPRSDRSGFDVVFEHPGAIAIIQWLAVAAAFGRVSQKWKLRWQIPAAVISVIAVCLFIGFGTGALGWEIQVDGP